MELCDWCRDHKSEITELKISWEDGRTWRAEQRQPVLDPRVLLDASDQIDGVLGTLRYVRSKKNLFKEVGIALAGGGSTPDHEYFGPVPDFSNAVGTGTGIGGVAGRAVAIVSGFEALRQQKRAMKQELKDIEEDSLRKKAKLQFSYYNLISRLEAMVRLAAESEVQADKLFRRGFTVDIARRAWSIAKTFNWLVKAA